MTKNEFAEKLSNFLNSEINDEALESMWMAFNSYQSRVLELGKPEDCFDNFVARYLNFEPS